MDPRFFLSLSRARSRRGERRRRLRSRCELCNFLKKKNLKNLKKGAFFETPLVQNENKDSGEARQRFVDVESVAHVLEPTPNVQCRDSRFVFDSSSPKGRFQADLDDP